MLIKSTLQCTECYFTIRARYWLIKSVKITNIVHNNYRQIIQIQLKYTILTTADKLAIVIIIDNYLFAPRAFYNTNNHCVNTFKRLQDGVPASDFVNFRLLSTSQLSTNWNIGLHTRDLF